MKKLHRVMKFLEIIYSDNNTEKVIDYYTYNKLNKEHLELVTQLLLDNKKEAYELWISNPELSLSQVLIKLKIIPNHTGLRFFQTEESVFNWELKIPNSKLYFVETQTGVKSVDELTNKELINIKLKELSEDDNSNDEIPIKDVITYAVMEREYLKRLAKYLGQDFELSPRKIENKELNLSIYVNLDKEQLSVNFNDKVKHYKAQETPNYFKKALDKLVK